MQKEGDIYVSEPGKMSQMRAPPKLMRNNVKESLLYFIEKSEKTISREDPPAAPADLNSNLEIPGYNNSHINGKGYSFNPHPTER